MMLSENMKVIPLALAPDADRWTGDPASDVVFLKNYNRVSFFLVEGAGGTGAGTVTVEACDDAVPTNVSEITFRYRTLTTAGGLDTWSDWTVAPTTGYAWAAGANKALEIDVKSDELPEGYPAVRVQMTESDSTAVDGAIFAIAYEPRYSGNQMPSALA